VEARVPSILGYQQLETAGEMGRLTGRVLRCAVTPPYSWVGECVTEMATSLRRCLLPGLLSMTAFGIGIACVFFGGIIRLLGTPDRLGGGIALGFTREPGFWVAIMILAGVAGSAMTADLGARKVREELDALRALGVDELRALIVPRCIALALLGPVLGVITLITAWLATFIGSIAVFHAAVLTPAAFVESFKAWIFPLDLVNFILKATVAGFFVGVVSCHKGVNCTGGAEGVGRAVNSAVLISFVGVWVIDILFNTIFLSAFPSVSALRG
jgi:phospholipid/cholesterol/gamma-HCH transport system permease protein